jgi:hypothetical protein
MPPDIPGAKSGKTRGRVIKFNNEFRPEESAVYIYTVVTETYKFNLAFKLLRLLNWFPASCAQLMERS